MNFRRMTILAILLIGSLLLSGASKTEGSKEIIGAGEVMSEDHFFNGEYFENNGIIDGSLFVAANEVLINGDVKGNIFIFSRTDTIITGDVQGDIYIMTPESVSITGRIDGSIFVFGKNVNIEQRAEIERSLYGVGENINIYGAINRDGKLYSYGNILVKGDVHGDLEYTARTTNIVSGTVGGKTIEREVREPKRETLLEVGTGRLLSTISFIFTNLIVWFLMAFVFKETRQKTKGLLSGEKGKLFFVYGSFGLLASIGVAITFFVTYIGIPFGLITAALIAGMLYLSTGVFIVSLSDILGLKYPRYAGGNNILYVVILSVVYGIIQIIPILGGVTASIVSVMGYGLIIGSLYHRSLPEEEHNLIL